MTINRNHASSQITIDLIESDDQYYPATTPEYRGNPLIEVIPPLDRALIRDLLLASDIRCTDEDREQPAEERMRRVRRLFHYFKAFPAQVEFAMHMWNAICDAYQPWNPNKPSTTAARRELFEQLATRTLPVTAPTTLSQLPHCLTKIGTPGCGKTEVPLRMLSKLAGNAIFKHARYGHLFQCLYIWVDAPTTKTDRALAWAVYDKLHEQLAATGSVHPRVSSKTNATELGCECALIARKLNLGLLGIDEIQHWFKKKVGLDEDAISFLTSLIARAKCAVLIVGTWQAIPILRASLRLGRRMAVPGTTFVRKLPRGKKFVHFLEQLFEKQYTKQQAGLNPDFVEAFYEGSQGIPDMVVKLMVFAQMTAITEEVEVISPEIVRYCTEEYLHPISPALRAMAGGADESDPTIWDAEPEDLDEYFQRLVSAHEIRYRSEERKALQEEIPLELKASQAAQHITDLGLGTPAQALDIASALTQSHPNKSVAELVMLAVKNSRKASLRLTKVPKDMVQMDQDAEQMLPEDIRRITYQAVRAERDIEAALDDAGHLFHPQELEVA